MALPGMGTTSYEDMRGLRAAGGGPRAARPRERTFVDHEMGSLHLVGGQRGAPEFGAWACMTHCPYEAPKPPSPFLHLCTISKRRRRGARKLYKLEKGGRTPRTAWPLAT